MALVIYVADYNYTVGKTQDVTVSQKTCRKNFRVMYFFHLLPEEKHQTYKEIWAPALLLFPVYGISLALG